MNRAALTGLVGLGVAAGMAGTTYLLHRRQKKVEAGEAAPELQPGEEGGDADRESDEPESDETELELALGDEIEWRGVLQMPTADDVNGDLESNWGTTPVDLRALFLLMEESSGIVGSGRIFSAIAYGESRWIPTAHNGAGDEDTDQRERAASRRAYENRKAKNPPLKYGERAADFGSGGLFGALAPYFLWTGTVAIGHRAPLLDADPRIVFLPRVAAFGACVYLQRLLNNYRIDDHLDIKVGWASPSLLVGERRTSATTKAVRSKFSEHAATVGINLVDAATVPSVLSVAAFPGVLELFEAMVGELPTPVRRTS